MIFQINYEYQTEEQIRDRTAQSTRIYVRAAGEQRAVDNAIAFWKNRHSYMPEYFHRVGAVTIHVFDPQELNDNGSLKSSGVSRKVFEWKITTGCGPGVTVGPSLVKNPMTDMFNEVKP